MNDTSSNAMTEVALGLSMAFFALLILSLISSMASTHQVHNNQKVEQVELDASLEENSSHVVSTKAASEDSANESSQAKVSSNLYVFYWKGRFYDQDLNDFHAATIPKRNFSNVYLVLEPDVALAQLIELKSSLQTLLSSGVNSQAVRKVGDMNYTKPSGFQKYDRGNETQELIIKVAEMDNAWRQTFSEHDKTSVNES